MLHMQWVTKINKLKKTTSEGFRFQRNCGAVLLRKKNAKNWVSNEFQEGQITTSTGLQSWWCWGFALSAGKKKISFLSLCIFLQVPKIRKQKSRALKKQNYMADSQKTCSDQDICNPVSSYLLQHQLCEQKENSMNCHIPINIMSGANILVCIRQSLHLLLK